jgi:hypothetical protein
MDDNLCEDQITVVVNDSEGPTVDAIQEDEHCDDGEGYVIIFGIGGQPPYTYSFNGSNFTPNDFHGDLQSDFYEICVRDNAGCEDCKEIFIDNDDPPRFDSVTVTQATCSQNNGTITVYAWSFFPLTYSINNGVPQNSNQFTGLGPGTYTIGIHDPYGCVTTVPVVIAPLVPPVIDQIIVVDAGCVDPGW